MRNKLIDIFRKKMPDSNTKSAIYNTENSISDSHTSSDNETVDDEIHIKSVNVKQSIPDIEIYTQAFKSHCLEKNSHTHLLKALSYHVHKKEGSTEAIEIEGDAFVFHEEHQVIRIESSYFIKYVQQEYNPLTRLVENAYD
jgi:hypothetical protein